MRTVAIIGAGRMGEAIISGMRGAGGWPADRILAVEPRPERAEELSAGYGIRLVGPEEAVSASDVVIVAVKPQDVSALLSDVGPLVPSTTLVVSICAGLPTSLFEAHLAEGTPVVRVMPNTPALVGEGMSALSAGSGATAEHLDMVEEILRPLGRVVRVAERYQDAVTALSGSGPAYFFYLIDAMTEAGVMLGLPREVAYELVLQTARGSVTMLRETGEHPARLREAVTSPAGTTIAALRELDERAVRAAMFSAIEAARDRAQELAEGVKP